MLSEKLSNIQNKPVETKCRIPLLLEQLSEEDAKALVDALGNPNIGHRVIWRVLKEEGHTIGKESILNASACIRGKSECKCMPEWGNKS